MLGKAEAEVDMGAAVWGWVGNVKNAGRYGLRRLKALCIG